MENIISIFKWSILVILLIVVGGILFVVMEIKMRVKEAKRFDEVYEENWW